MTKEKQIGEMARAMCDRETTCKECPVYICRARIHAANAYKAGYRKQEEGEWLHDTKWDTFYCSICNESALNDCYEHQSLSGYCPHCGAKMKGGA